MVVRFDKDCREVVTIAQDRARDWRHAFIGPEHLLVGLLDHGGGQAQSLRANGIDPDRVRREIEGMAGSGLDGDALAVLGIDLRAVRDAVERRFGPGALDRADRARPLLRHLPVTRRAKADLADAARAAKRFHHQAISPDHLWLAVLVDPEGAPSRALRAAGADPAALRAAIAQRLRHDGSGN